MKKNVFQIVVVYTEFNYRRKQLVIDTEHGSVVTTHGATQISS